MTGKFCQIYPVHCYCADQVVYTVFVQSPTSSWASAQSRKDPVRQLKSRCRVSKSHHVWLKVKLLENWSSNCLIQCKNRLDVLLNLQQRNTYIQETLMGRCGSVDYSKFREKHLHLLLHICVYYVYKYIRTCVCIYMAMDVLSISNWHASVDRDEILLIFYFDWQKKLKSSLLHNLHEVWCLKQ